MLAVREWVVWAAQTQKQPGGDLGGMVLMFAVLGLFLWIIVLRPQKKERDERQRVLNSVKKGDRVVTIGGVHGKVSDVDDAHNLIKVEIAPKVTVTLNRTAIASVDSKGSDKAPAKTDGAEETVGVARQ